MINKENQTGAESLETVHTHTHTIHSIKRMETIYSTRATLYVIWKNNLDKRIIYKIT